MLGAAHNAKRLDVVSVGPDRRKITKPASNRTMEARGQGGSIMTRRQDGGFYRIPRIVWRDPFFPRERFTRREAWIWLVGAATWKDQEIITGPNGALVTLRRGEFCHSVRFLAEAWRWSKSGTARMLDMLQKRDRLSLRIWDGNQVYLINGYNEMQGQPRENWDTGDNGNGDDDGTRAGQQAGHARDKDKGREGNNNSYTGGPSNDGPRTFEKELDDEIPF